MQMKSALKMLGLWMWLSIQLSFAQSEIPSATNPLTGLYIKLNSQWEIRIVEGGGGSLRGIDDDRYVGGSFKKGTFDLVSLQEKCDGRYDGKKKLETDLLARYSTKTHQIPMYVERDLAELVFEQSLSGLTPVARSQVKKALEKTPFFGMEGTPEAIFDGRFLGTISISTHNSWSITIYPNGSGTIYCRFSDESSASFKEGSVDPVTVVAPLAKGGLSEKKTANESLVVFRSPAGEPKSGYTKEEIVIQDAIEKAVEGLTPLAKSKYQRFLKQHPLFER